MSSAEGIDHHLSVGSGLTAEAAVGFGDVITNVRQGSNGVTALADAAVPPYATTGIVYQASPEPGPWCGRPPGHGSGANAFTAPCRLLTPARSAPSNDASHEHGISLDSLAEIALATTPTLSTSDRWHAVGGRTTHVPMDRRAVPPLRLLPQDDGAIVSDAERARTSTKPVAIVAAARPRRGATRSPNGTSRRPTTASSPATLEARRLTPGDAGRPVLRTSPAR
jgi:hypothetical protein